MENKQILLAGDLGASNVRLALYTKSSGQYQSLIEKKYSVHDHNAFESIIEIFLKDIPNKIDAASFAVAGPVIGGKVNITNLGWDIDITNLEKLLMGIPVALINDLMGMSSSIPILQKEDFVELNPGIPNENASISVIAPGTGLGEGYLHYIKGEYIAFTSEGGNTDFAPKNEIEYALLEFLQKKYEHVSFERVCSGLAIQDLYQFFKENGEIKESTSLAKEITTSQDPSALIVNAATNSTNPDPLSLSAMKLFVKVLGAEAGNLALKTMSLGGVYLGGGIPPRIIPLIKKYFLTSFLDKGRYRYIMESIPVKIITHPQPALVGAARYGFKNLFS